MASEQNNIVPNNKRIAKNAFFLYIRLAVIMVVNLYIARVVLANLGIDDYGVYNVVCGFVAMFGFFGTSMSNGIQRFYNYELGKTGDLAVVKVFNIAIIQQVAIALILAVLLLTVGSWYLNNVMVVATSRIDAANWILVFSIISLVLVIVQTPFTAAVIAYERMNFFAIVSIIDTFIKLGVAYGVKYVPTDRLILYGFLLMLVQLLNFVLYFCYCKLNFSHLKFKRYFDRTLFMSMLSFSGWNLLGSFAFMMCSQGVNVLLNSFFGTAINAANGIASQVSHAVQSFSTNIMLAFQPQLVQSYAVANYNRVEQLMFNMTKISYILLGILTIPVIIEVDYILALWLGSNIPNYTKIFIVLTSVVMGLGLFHTSITRVFHATGKIKSFQIVTCVVICAVLPISWLCLKNGASPESVYAVTIIAYLVNWLVCLYMLYGVFKYNVKRYALMIVECIILTIVSLLLASYLHNVMSESFVRLISIFAIVLVSQTGGLWLMLSKSERQQIITTFRKRGMR